MEGGGERGQRTRSGHAPAPALFTAWWCHPACTTAQPRLLPLRRRLLISIPLSYSGGIIAAKQEIRQYPTRTNQIPRHIPPPHWASHPLVLFFAAGLLPFGTIFVELYFAMTSMWQVGGAWGGSSSR